MGKAAVKVGSVTYAARGKDILTKNGFRVYITRDTNPGKGEGCGYLLCVEGDCPNAVTLLKKNGVKVYGVSNNVLDCL